MANALVDPLCPYFLYALAVTCRDFYAASKTLLSRLKDQHLDVLELCPNPGSPLQSVRMTPELVLATRPFRISRCFTLHSGFKNGKLKGDFQELLTALRRLVRCEAWWSTITTIDLAHDHEYDTKLQREISQKCG